MSIKYLVSAGLFFATASAAHSEICDFRLSQLIGGASTGAAIAATGGTAASGLAFEAAGFYLIVHSTGGMTMIGSTLAGASGAGTIGIISGTGGGLGAVAAFLTAPVTIVVAGTASVGAGGMEAVCYFRDERITDYDDVLQILRGIAPNMEPSQFRLTEPESTQPRAFISILMEPGEPLVEFDVRNLYFVNGRLMHRDWGRNTIIGDLSALIRAVEPDRDK